MQFMILYTKYKYSSTQMRIFYALTINFHLPIACRKSLSSVALQGQHSPKFTYMKSPNFHLFHREDRCKNVYARHSLLCYCLGFSSCTVEVSVFQGYRVASLGDYCPKFRGLAGNTSEDI